MIFELNGLTMSKLADLLGGIDMGLIHQQYSFDFSHNLLRSLCEQAENQIDIGIAEFHEKGTEFEEIEVIEEEGIVIGFDHFGGLTDQDVNLNEIFTEYFPSVQRRSVFLTIFGIFEHELESFCKRHIRISEGKLKLSDLRGSGVERANLYVEKVLGLKCDTYPLIEQLKELRNACAHQDAKHSTADGQEIKKVTKLLEKYPDKLCKGDREVIMKSGFLFEALESFYQYFKEIEDYQRALKQKVGD